MKVTTIINNGKLVGYIKLQEEILANLQPDEVIILEREINRGDSTITTFRLKKYKPMGKVSAIQPHREG